MINVKEEEGKKQNNVKARGKTAQEPTEPKLPN